MAAGKDAEFKNVRKVQLDSPLSAYLTVALDEQAFTTKLTKELYPGIL